MQVLDNGDKKAQGWGNLAGVVSPNTLLARVRCELRVSPEADGAGLLAFLRQVVLESYLHKSLTYRLRQKPFLSCILSGRTVEDAARDDAIPVRTAEAWLSDFAAFVRVETARQQSIQEQRQRDIDSAWAYCAESCGRKKQHEPGAPERRTSNDVSQTAKTPRAPGNRCPGCPLTALGV